MSRHRNVRSMNYSDEYDGFDDVYGHSVEDDYCISPSDAAFMYDRSRQQPAEISNFLAEEDDIAEEDERPVLNDLDEAKLQSCLDEIHTVVGDSVAENIIIQTIVDSQFDLAKSLDTILKTQSSSKEEPPKPQRVRRHAPGEKDDKSVAYGSEICTPKLDKKNRKCVKSLKGLEAGDGISSQTGQVSDKYVCAKQMRSKNSHRKSKNKFGNIDKGYLHANIRLNLVKNNEESIPKLINQPLLVKDSVNKFNEPNKHNLESNFKEEVEDHVKFTHINIMEESSVQNPQPNIIKPTSLLEQGIEIESVNYSSSLCTLLPLTANRQEEIEPSFSLDDMVSDLLKDDVKDESENFRSPKRSNSDLDIVDRYQQISGIKKRLSSDESTTLILSEGINIPKRDNCNLDSMADKFKYSQSIESDDDDEPFSLAHLVAKHEKSNVRQDHEQLSLDDLVSKHLETDCINQKSVNQKEISLDRLVSDRLLNSGEDDSTYIANLASKHLNICDSRTGNSITSCHNSPVFSTQCLFGDANVPRSNLLDSKQFFGITNTSPKNIFGSPDTLKRNANTLLGSPNVFNLFGNSNISPQSSFGSANSQKIGIYNKPNSLTKDDISCFSPISMSPKYFKFGDSGEHTKLDSEIEERQRTISSDSQDQDIFDDDDTCFFEPTINLTSALLPSVIGENRNSNKKTDTGILNQKWTADLSSALSPGSETDVLMTHNDWQFPPLEETVVELPVEECCIDATPILYVKSSLKAKKCSSFGKIICKKLNKSPIILFKEETDEQTTVTPFTFDSLSPDDQILRHFNRRL